MTIYWRVCGMGNLIIPDVAGVGNSLLDSKGLNNNFKAIQQSKSS